MRAEKFCSRNIYLTRVIVPVLSVHTIWDGVGSLIFSVHLPTPRTVIPTKKSATNVVDDMTHLISRQLNSEESFTHSRSNQFLNLVTQNTERILHFQRGRGWERKVH